MQVNHHYYNYNLIFLKRDTGIGWATRVARINIIAFEKRGYKLFFVQNFNLNL